MVEVVKHIINNPAVQGGLGALVLIAMGVLLLNVSGYGAVAICVGICLARSPI